MTGGIYVEVNPTSNMTIGEIPSMHEEHILNLNSRGIVDNPEKKREVLVTINSDDPLIFNTNSENELAYVYHSLVHKHYNKERVLEWINKVRKMGIESSFVKEERKPSQQYEEIKDILEKIDTYLKS